MRINLLYAVTFATALILANCSNDAEKSMTISSERLINADRTPEEWLSHGRNYYENRYSSLNEINDSTVHRLGLAWSINLGTKRGLEATPIVANGMMYFSRDWSKVYAVDLRREEIKWTYDPKVPKEYGERVCCDVVNRGVAIYEDLVFVGTLDGRLVALHA